MGGLRFPTFLGAKALESQREAKASTEATKEENVRCPSIDFVFHSFSLHWPR